MRLLIFIPIILIPVLLLKFRSLHLHIDIKSFFKKGFNLFNTPHGLICFTGDQGSRQDIKSALDFLIT